MKHSDCRCRQCWTRIIMSGVMKKKELGLSKTFKYFCVFCRRIKKQTNEGMLSKCSECKNIGTNKKSICVTCGTEKFIFVNKGNQCELCSKGIKLQEPPQAVTKDFCLDCYAHTTHSKYENILVC